MRVMIHRPMPSRRQASGALFVVVLCAVAGLWLLTPAGSAALGQIETADLILHHGKVWTVDEAKPLAEAVAVRGSR
ncbi:MAG: hypothetical protein ACREEM_10715, partial [Blastocatellia bacterium]